MRLVRVNAYEVALLFKRGKLIEVLTEGWYFRMDSGLRVELCNTTWPLEAGKRMPLLLENDQFVKMTKVVTISEHEIGVEYRNGLFQRVIEPGQVAYWDSPIKYELEIVNMKDVEVPEHLARLAMNKKELSDLMRIYTIESYELGILYINGQYEQILEPGVYYYWKTDEVVSISKVDTRMQSLEVLGQEILTKDKAGLRANFQIQYKVVDVEKALIDNKAYDRQLYIALQMALREYMSEMTLDQVLANKQNVGPYVISALEGTSEKLGIEIISGGIKDIILPGDIKDIMNQVLVAQKRAQANSITRHEETASTRSLLNTAKLMEQNEMLLKLKEMEYMEKIADKIGEITVNGGKGVMSELQKIFVNAKT